MDEPTNHLDCESVAWLERFLAGDSSSAPMLCRALLELSNLLLTQSHDKEPVTDSLAYLAAFPASALPLF